MRLTSNLLSWTRRLPWIIAFSLLCVVLLSGCLKDAPVFSATVCLEVKHHGVPQNGVTVYHFANREDFPSFDDSSIATSDSTIETVFTNRACFEQLGYGPHIFLGIGYDELLRDTVLGSLRLDLTVRDTQVDTVLQVSERH